MAIKQKNATGQKNILEKKTTSQKKKKKKRKNGRIYYRKEKVEKVA